MLNTEGIQTPTIQNPEPFQSGRFGSLDFERLQTKWLPFCSKHSEIQTPNLSGHVRISDPHFGQINSAEISATSIPDVKEYFVDLMSHFSLLS